MFLKNTDGCGATLHSHRCFFPPISLLLYNNDIYGAQPPGGGPGGMGPQGGAGLGGGIMTDAIIPITVLTSPLTVSVGMFPVKTMSRFSMETAPAKGS